jgi:ATP-dependent Clp endopeptidase proteolytic subunit ClpP
MHGARPLRSTRRLSNLAGGARSGLLPWYRITNRGPGQPTLVSIYDEIGMYGVPAGEFLADLAGVNGDIECHINSPGGDIFDGLTIYNQLKARSGTIHMVIDGLAASAASFIAQAASPGMLEMAPRSKIMIHNGFGAAFGDASDMRKTADILDELTGDIASIYAERSGKPVQYWLGKMAEETWYSDKEAVQMGLADRITGQAPPQASWDMSVYAHFPSEDLLELLPGMVWLNADGTHSPMTGTHEHSHPAYGSQGSDAQHSHEHTHDGDASHNHSHASMDDGGGSGAQDRSRFAPQALDGDVPLGGGWVHRAGKVVFDPDGDGDDDSTADGDTDHDHWDENGKQIRDIPPRPSSPSRGVSDRSPFPALNADVDNSPWDGARAWANGAKSDDPAAFYKAICAGRKAGDPKTQAAWALPYKFTPSSPPNAGGVRAAWAAVNGARGGVEGLTNAAEAKAKLQRLMKQVSPDWEPEGRIDPGALRSVLRMPSAEIDYSDWDPALAWAAGAGSDDPEMFYRGICAGRRAGDPASQEAWALPYRYRPGAPPNAQAVREALARLPRTRSLTNKAEARRVLEAAMKRLDPDGTLDDHIDSDLLSAVFTAGLEGSPA